MYFRESDHTYWVDETCSKQLISVTQLLKKHGLAPDYSGVSQKVLDDKARLGNVVHEEIEKWIKERKMGFTEELQEFISYLSLNNVNALESEKMVGNDLYAGKLDLVLKKGDQKIIADIKNTYTLHTESVSWQLSLYLYLYDNENYYNYIGECYHFNKQKVLEVIYIPLKSKSDVESLLECERKGTIYRPTFDIGLLNEMYQVNQTIANYKALIDEAEKRYDEMKQAILNEMKSRGITQYQDSQIILSYVAPTTRKSVDSKALKEKYPDIYDELLKESEVKESLRIKFKEQIDE